MVETPEELPLTNDGNPAAVGAWRSRSLWNLAATLGGAKGSSSNRRGIFRCQRSDGKKHHHPKRYLQVVGFLGGGSYCYSSHNPGVVEKWPYIGYTTILGGGSFKHFFIFTKDVQCDEHIFQRGWFNHQLGMIYTNLYVYIYTSL